MSSLGWPRRATPTKVSRRVFVGVALRGHPMVHSLSGDDCADMLSIERPRQITALESVDDLNRPLVSCVLHELKDAALYDHVLQIELLKFGYANLRDKLRIAVLLRIGGEQSSFILHEDH